MKILFVDGTPGFSPDRKDKKACGGILNSLTIIPQYLASKGHEVYVASSYEPEETINGVHYHPISKEIGIPKWDITVLNRNGVNAPLVRYSHEIGAKVVWWLHDIVDFRYLYDSSYREVDKVIALSNYCKMSFSDFYEIPEDKFVVIPNGVDKTIFYPGKYDGRTKYKIIMASALIKGFTPVYDTWMNIKRQLPNPSLTIYSGQSLHELKNNSLQDLFLKEMEEVGATIQQPIPQHILADKMREAWILLMPNSYPEICSNLLLQARACGLPVVTTNTGSVPEFITNGKTGIISKHYPHDLFLWIKGYVEATVKLCKDEILHKRISEETSKDIQSWEKIGEKWNETFKELIK